jgi:hypothetical protein
MRKHADRQPPKPESTYSPIGAVPEDDPVTRRRLALGRGNDDVRPVETSRAENEPRPGLTLAEEETHTAGGNRK